MSARSLPPAGAADAKSPAEKAEPFPPAEDAEPLPPVAFGAWVAATLDTLLRDAPADVPCGPCNACCRTFHQLHLRPGEKRARKRLPKEYMSVARGLPPGYLLLGYTEEGACPVLVDGRCAVYEDRPLVCRTYDCRLYAATGVEPDRAEIAAQVRRWRFAYPRPEDRELREAVLAALAFIRRTPSCLPGEAARQQPIRLATLSVVTHELFRPGATRGVRRRPVSDRDRAFAVADANEELFGDG